MYRGKKICVAIATYNGVSHLEEQLDSIAMQTVVPDEIVISDDGSKDGTMIAARRFAETHQNAVNTKIITDNPRHGIGGNFEWAIKHTTGDIIFICGQDDVWLPEKVHHVAEVFLQSDTIEMVCHDLRCIDADSNPLPQHQVNSLMKNLGLKEGEVIHISREKYLDAVASSVIISGPAVAITRSLADRCMPIPDFLPEDWWTQFCAVADDSAYFLNETLTCYRIHNSATHSASIGLTERIRKTSKTVRGYAKTVNELLHFSTAARSYLEISNVDPEANAAAFSTIGRVEEIGNKLIEAVGGGKISGLIKTIKLYKDDIRYRRMGKGNFYVQLLNILFVSKKKRRAELGLDE